MLTSITQWHDRLNAGTTDDEEPRVRQFGLRPVVHGQGWGQSAPTPEVWAWQQPDGRPSATPTSGDVRVGFTARRFHLGHVGLARSVAQTLPEDGRVLLFGGPDTDQGAVRLFEHMLTWFGAPDCSVEVVPDDDDALRRTQREALAVLHVGKLARVYGWDDSTPASVFTDLGTMLGAFLHAPSRADRRDVVFVDAKQAAHSVALARAGRALGLPTPTLLYRRLFPSLRLPTGRGSVKDPASTIFLDDAPADVRRKVRSAVTGGRDHVDDQRARGGDPVQCPLFASVELLRPADEAQATLVACQSGDLLCGECKALHVEAVARSVVDLGTPSLRAGGRRPATAGAGSGDRP
ncbi:hypothetical protein [Cellulomonas sp. S1-8]|uniref:hypothetical protein n=1 Tax=Cellulomonas sp. S1-8 TaxID=2904790 RepID=UPI002243C7E4|nr:hypothetical protein [Cellulomonas sp. S1-8]UZN03405.1 hypothetical protein OKX07_00215 [Cellulomonas sp. S1-8]